ncbi:MAG TPA: hypothetical protein VHM65_05590 [Candidatus Lustribacter sp.]|nr:hypothetical protein [Candidatus Lustribacter sp.]
MSMLLEEATWTDRAGIHFTQPEIVLLFKARHQRAKDEANVAATLPLLSACRRDWLRTALAQVHPDHDWVHRLGAEA